MLNGIIFTSDAQQDEAGIENGWKWMDKKACYDITA